MKRSIQTTFIHWCTLQLKSVYDHFVIFFDANAEEKMNGWKKNKISHLQLNAFFHSLLLFPFLSLSLPRYSFECVFSDACLDSASFRYFGYYLSYNLENDETFSVWFYQYIDSRRVKANPLLLDGNHDDVSKHTHALISFAISVSLSPFLQWFLPIFTWSLLRLCFIILVFDYDGI